MSSADVDASSSTAVDLSTSEIRAAFNPFKHDCWLDFANRVTRGYMEQERDPFIPLAGQHRRWLERFAAGDDFVLLAHRFGLKTTICLIYIIARLEYDAGYRALWITNTRTQARKKADDEFNKLVERNPWLTELNKDREKDTTKDKVFANGSVFNSGWLHGGLEGERADCIVFDDLIKEQGDGETEDIWRWVSGAALPIGKQDSQEVFIGTRKRPNDLYQYIQNEASAYNLYEYPLILDYWDHEHGDDADWKQRRPNPDLYTEVPNPLSGGGASPESSDVADDTVHVLWPEARGPDFIREKRSKTGHAQFLRAYCLVLAGASGNLIDAQDINKPVNQGGCSIHGESPPGELRAGQNEAILVGHDPAQSPTGDNAAFVAIKFGADGRRTLLDARAEVGMSPSSIRAELADMNRRFDPAVIAIEDNGIQQYIVNDAMEMGAEMRAKVRGYSTTGKKHTWENGVPQLRTLIESGSFHFYRGHTPTEDFINAATTLQLDDGKLTGHTPDLIAAWYMTEKAQRDGISAGSSRVYDINPW